MKCGGYIIKTHKLMLDACVMPSYLKTCVIKIIVCDYEECVLFLIVMSVDMPAVVVIRLCPIQAILQSLPSIKSIVTPASHLGSLHK